MTATPSDQGAPHLDSPELYRCLEWNKQACLPIIQSKIQDVLFLGYVTFQADLVERILPCGAEVADSLKR